MKKLLIGVIALIACLAIGSAPATAKLQKHVIDSSITLSVTLPPGPYAPYAPYAPRSGVFSGKVSAKGPSGCRKDRTVVVSRIGPTQTRSDGSYSITDPTKPEPGTYTANVRREVIKTEKDFTSKNGTEFTGKKFICTKAHSNPVTVP